MNARADALVLQDDEQADLDCSNEVSESACLAALVKGMYTHVPKAGKFTPREWNTLVDEISWSKQASYSTAEHGQLKRLRDSGKKCTQLASAALTYAPMHRPAATLRPWCTQILSSLSLTYATTRLSSL